MKNANISELENHLMDLLDYVRRGGTVRVFDRDQPIADLTPCRFATTTDAGEPSLLALERDGLLRRGARKLPDDFLRRRLPKAKASVLRALLDERANDR